MILSGAEVLDTSRQINYIVPFPYSSNLGLSDGGVLLPRLSVMSRASIDAAVEVFEHHRAAEIIIAGEACYGDELLDTSQLMVKRAQREAADLPERALVPVRTPSGGAPNNTYLQSEAIANYFDNKNDQHNILVIALQYHLKRVKHTVEAYGVPRPNFVSVEAVFEAAGITEYDEYLKNTHGLESSERILRMINMVDRKGRLLNVLMRKSGPRLVDVVDDENGQPILEQGLAKDKLARLNRSKRSLSTRAA